MLLSQVIFWPFFTWSSRHRRWAGRVQNEGREVRVGDPQRRHRERDTDKFGRGPLFQWRFGTIARATEDFVPRHRTGLYKYRWNVGFHTRTTVQTSLGDFSVLPTRSERIHIRSPGKIRNREPGTCIIVVQNKHRATQHISIRYTTTTPITRGKQLQMEQAQGESRAKSRAKGGGREEQMQTAPTTTNQRQQRTSHRCHHSTTNNHHPQTCLPLQRSPRHHPGTPPVLARAPAKPPRPGNLQFRSHPHPPPALLLLRFEVARPSRPLNHPDRYPHPLHPLPHPHLRRHRIDLRLHLRCLTFR